MPHTDVVDLPGNGMSPYASQLDINDPAGAQPDRSVGVSIHHQPDAGIMPSNLGYDLNILSGFNFQLDPLVSRSHLALDFLQQCRG